MYIDYSKKFLTADRYMRVELNVLEQGFIPFSSLHQFLLLFFALTFFFFRLQKKIFLI